MAGKKSEESKKRHGHNVDRFTSSLNIPIDIYVYIKIAGDDPKTFFYQPSSSSEEFISWNTKLYIYTDTAQ